MVAISLILIFCLFGAPGLAQNQTKKTGEPALAAPLAVSAKNPTNGIKTIVLEQHSDCLGHVNTYVNKEAVKIVVEGTTVCLIARAPDWHVVFYNQMSKKAVVMSLKQWTKHLMQTMYAVSDYDRFDLHLVNTKLVIRNGRNFQQSVVCKQVRPAVIDKKGDYLALPVTDVPGPAYLILAKALNCPGSQALPIEFYLRDLQHKKMEAFSRKTTGEHTYLNTAKITEKIVPQSFFLYPIQTIAVSREADVINDDARKNKVEDVIKDLL